MGGKLPYMSQEHLVQHLIPPPSELTLTSDLSKANELCILDVMYHLEDTTWSRQTSKRRVSGVTEA